MKILVTGASGFIGSYIVEEALKRGFETWAAVRPTSSRRYLKDERIHFVELDFDDEQRLVEQLRPYEFDYVVHAAGVTKCVKKSDFFRVNTEGTRHLVDALLTLGMPVKKFVYLSSLSVFGNVCDSLPHVDILETDIPRPNTAYGRSKLQAEDYLQQVSDRLNCVILRPTGVYGPREKDYFLMVQSLQRHMDFSVKVKPQDITFVYVDDLVQAVFLSLDKPESGRSYFLTDGEVYQSSTFSDYIHEELGSPWRVKIEAPVWLMRAITTLGECLGKLTGRATALNRDKFHILTQANWRCDVGTAMLELGYQPQVKLREGVRRTVEWYKREGWIK